tara:strand:+ start:137 stop:688 length:552 start_codon:yes stop_codon:yes gene_type:complete
MEKANKILVDEHINILRIADGIEKECNILNEGKRIDDGFFIAIVDFIRNYADKFHHAKEEDILFKELGKESVQGKMHCNPMDQMLVEHDQGRGFVKAIEEGMSERNRKKVIENALSYVRLIREHISKEDDILYPMAEEALGKEGYNKLLKKFEKVGKERDVENYLKLAEKLEGGIPLRAQANE